MWFNSVEEEEGIVVNQWIPSEMETDWKGKHIRLNLTQNGQYGLYPLNGWSVEGMTAITRVDIPSIPVHRPDRFVYDLTVACEQLSEFTIKVRLPWWLTGDPVILVNGTPYPGSFKPSSYCEISRRWSGGDTIHVEFPKRLSAEPLPGQLGTVAFLDGPIVLAGLSQEERRLSGNPEDPESMLIPDRERNHSWWNPGYYRTKDQDRGIRFIPLYEVKDEAYSVYFPVERIMNK
ncbi:hypothetical protein AB4Z22_29830 [Paenibacillus sp. TAF58]